MKRKQFQVHSSHSSIFYVFGITKNNVYIKQFYLFSEAVLYTKNESEYKILFFKTSNRSFKKLKE